jgi:hypothetical protein
VSIDVIWSRLRAHEGAIFRQVRGAEFRYAITDSALRPDRTDWNIPRGHIEEALSLVPLANTVAVQHLFGPSYIYAVLMDPRIRESDW